MFSEMQGWRRTFSESFQEFGSAPKRHAFIEPTRIIQNIRSSKVLNILSWNKQNHAFMSKCTDVLISKAVFRYIFCVLATFVSADCALGAATSTPIWQTWTDRRPIGLVGMGFAASSTSTNPNAWNWGGVSELGGQTNGLWRRSLP